MLHLRDTLPKLLESGHSSSELFPSDIYSSNVILKLPAPLPIRVSSTLPPRANAKLMSDHFAFGLFCSILNREKWDAR